MNDIKDLRLLVDEWNSKANEYGALAKTNIPTIESLECATISQSYSTRASELEQILNKKDIT